MKISMTSGRHMTATNKRHLVEMIEAGMTTGSSGRISYSLTALEGAGRYQAVIRKRESDDWGRPVTRKQTVEFTATA